MTGGNVLNKSTGIATALVLTVLLTACDKASSPLKWTEDVRLPDGRIVSLMRYQEFKGWRDLGSPPTVSDYWFVFKHPDTGQIVRWQSGRELRTDALMMDGRLPVLLVTPDFSEADRYHCPNPPYLLFRFEGSWKQVPVEQIPVKRFRVNMTFAPSESRELIESSRYHLTAEQTSNSMHSYRPYIINFSLMKEQTFDIQSCGRPLNWLVDKQ